ncbi:hypothetical protein ACAW74_05520 [Fibrella sp. WM1]|uniref:hypothetical protein n=1 Tax=Fibrella musci TaxID=3242485 RepID=UPI003522C81E
MTNKALCLLSLLTIGYFFLLCINGYLIRLNNPLLGAIQELVTIPALALEIVLLVVAAKRLSQTGLFRDRYLLTSFSVLCLNAFFIIGSFALAFLGHAV